MIGLNICKIMVAAQTLTLVSHVPAMTIWRISRRRTPNDLGRLAIRAKSGRNAEFENCHLAISLNCHFAISFLLFD